MTACLLPYDIEQIGLAVAHALDESFSNRARSEPQLVANLVSALPRNVNRISFSGRATVKAGGVFVHARPFVTCASFPATSPASVEIGDLLLIRTLVINKTVRERRALLLQAKKASCIPAKPDNPNQWHLYGQWPRFTYAAKSGALNGKARRINEPDMYDAAKYLLIGANASAPSGYLSCCVDWPFWPWPEPCIHHTAQPTKPELGRYRCFADELVAFLAGNAGKSFEEPASRTRGWNRVVNDLISETAKAKTIFMKGAASGLSAEQPSKFPRGIGVLFVMQASQGDHFMVAGGDGGGDFGGSADVPGEWGDDDEAGGISIIEFVVEQGEG